MIEYKGQCISILVNYVKIGPKTTNGTHPNTHGGVTLSLGGPSQGAGEKNWPYGFST